MNFLREYSEYDNLALPNDIILTNSERQEMCRIISDILDKYYPSDSKASRLPIEIGDKIILPNYLYKAINNRTLLKKLVYDPIGEIYTGIRNKEDLFQYVKNNGYDLFHYQGKYFTYIYNLLISTSKKGEVSENRAFDFFIKYAEQKGMAIEIIDPSLKEDMYGGIDGIFILNNKQYTIQVKPLFKIEDYKKDNTKYIAFCDGVLKSLKTDYLIVINNLDILIFRSKGIEVFASYFLIPKTNLVSRN
jgi:hypothetical protein